MSDTATITLGEREYTIVAQPIGRIQRKLVKLMGLAEGVGSFGELDADLHAFFKTFIPDLAPLYELLGYESENAYEARQQPSDDALEKRTPTIPQIFDAIKAIYTVNALDRLVNLGKDWIGEDAIKYRIRKAVMSSDLSPSSPAPNGELDSPSSTATPPTSTETREDPSPFPGSSISSTPETAAA